MEQRLESRDCRFILFRIVLCVGIGTAALFLLGGTREFLMERDSRAIQKSEVKAAAILCASCSGDQKDAMIQLAEQSPELMLRISAQSELSPVGE